MKSFTIIHDKLRNGEFPFQELNKIDGIHINAAMSGPFKQEITIGLEIVDHMDEQELLSTVFELGSLIGVILANHNYKK